MAQNLKNEHVLEKKTKGPIAVVEATKNGRC